MLKETNIQKNVLEKIHEGDIAMRSRSYFILRATLLTAAVLVLLAISFFLLSFVFFSVHESGIRYLLEFNEHGIATFVRLFPWLSLVLFIVIIVALEFLVRRYKFAYRFPLLRIFLWIVIIGIAGGTILGFTPLHSRLLSAADNDELPFLGSWYEQIHDSHQSEGVYRGGITSVSATYFVISHDDSDRDSDDGTWNIMPPTGFDLSQLSAGEKVYVAGRLINGVVYAYGLHLVTDDR